MGRVDDHPAEPDDFKALVGHLDLDDDHAGGGDEAAAFVAQRDVLLLSLKLERDPRASERVILVPL